MSKDHDCYWCPISNKINKIFTKNVSLNDVSKLSVLFFQYIIIAVL